MHPESPQLTLLEDWRIRRERLAGGPMPAGQLAELHVRILDYLIHCYGDSPEAARPARFSPRSDVYVNDRAIVVHHHLWEGKVSGVRNPQEAKRRVTEILGRMTAPDEDQAAAIEREALMESDPYGAGDLPANDPLWRALIGDVHASIRPGRDATEQIAALLQRSRIAPIDVVRYLYERLRNRDLEDPCAADLLLECENRSAPNYAVLAWRERLAAGGRDAVTDRLGELFSTPEVAPRVLDQIRAELANDSPAVRLAAIDVLGRIGTLEDIGLLSDLLSLPPLADEHPDERCALARAMQRIARTDSESED